MLEKSGKTAINVRNYSSLFVEIFETLKNPKPSFISDIFQLRLTKRPPRDQCKLTSEIPKTNQLKFRTKNIRVFGPKIWNSLPHQLKSTENLITFKRIIKRRMESNVNVNAQFAQITFSTCRIFVTITSSSITVFTIS